MDRPSLTFVSAIISAILAIMVGVLGHAFTQYRDRQSRLHKQRIDYLVSVYRAFCKAAHHPQLHEIADEVEQAIADVQLFGTPAQVLLAQSLLLNLEPIRSLILTG